MTSAAGGFMPTLTPEMIADPQIRSWLDSLWGAQTASQERKYTDALGLSQTQLANQNAYQMGSLGVQRQTAANTAAYQQGQLEESRADRQARLQLGMEQIAADRERTAVERGQMEADAQYKRDVAALQKQELGKSLLDTATQLFGTPGSWARAFNYARGVSGDQALAEPLRALLGGFSMPAFQMQTGTAEPLSMTGLADRLLGQGTSTGGTGGTAGGTSPADAEYQANTEAARYIGLNPQKMAPGSVESLKDDELSYLSDALRANTISPSSWLSAYAASRPGQGLSSGGLA